MTTSSLMEMPLTVGRGVETLVSMEAAVRRITPCMAISARAEYITHRAWYGPRNGPKGLGMRT